MSLGDSQRAMDLHALASQLSAMEAHVMSTAESSSHRAMSASAASFGGASPGSASGAFASSGVMGGGSGSGGGSDGGQGSGGLSQSAALMLALGPSVEPSVLPITEGRLFRKEGGITGRGWKERWVKVEGTTLAFYARAGDDKPRDRLALAPEMRVERPDKLHRNRAVKYDFDIVLDGADAPVSLYAETDEAGEAWITTVHYMIRRLADVEHAASTGLLPGEVHADRRVPPAGTSGADTNTAIVAPTASYANAQLLHLAAHAHAHDAATQQALADEALCHNAYGPGLFEAVRGEPAHFTVQTNEASGAPRLSGGDTITLRVQCSSTGLSFDLTPMDNGDGTYHAEYTPTRAGPHVLHVQAYGHDIYGSPFFPVVTGAPASAAHCKVSGDGATTAYVGGVNKIIITAIDAFDEPRTVGGDVFVASVPPHSPGLLIGIMDQGDGTYLLEYEVDADHPVLRNRAANAAPQNVEILIALNNPSFPYPRPVAASPVRAVISNVAPLRSAAASTAIAAIPAVPYMATRPSVAGRPASSLQARENTQPSPSPRSPQRPHMPDSSLDASGRAEKLAVEEERRLLDEQRLQVQQQMIKMTELGKKVKEDSERLAEQARALRTAQAANRSTPAARASSRRAPADASSLDATALSMSSSAVAAPTPTPAPAPTPTPAPAPAPASVALQPPSAAELFHPDVITLLDTHKRALVALWQYYSGVSRARESAAGAAGANPYGCAEGLDAKRFVTLFSDFDVAPTFLTKRELKFIFSAAALAAGEAAGADGHAGADARLAYPSFCEALGRSALVALSKPTFATLYPTPVDKLRCLIEMWGVGDAGKLQDIIRRAPRAGSVATGLTRNTAI